MTTAVQETHQDKAAAKLSALGFRVKEMVGGIDWWARRDDLPVETGTAVGTIRCGC
jgi:hypothetical protein